MANKFSNNKYERLLAITREIIEKYKVTVVLPQSPITTPVEKNCNWHIIDHCDLIVPPFKY